MVTSNSRSDVVERQLFQARTRMQSAHLVLSQREREFLRLQELLVARGAWEEFCKRHGWSPEATPRDHCA